MNLTTLSHIDLRFVASRIPRDIRGLMEKHGIYLAGGFIRATIAGEKPSDIDLFGASKDALKLVALELAQARGGRMHETQNAYTVLTGHRMPVQFIHRWLYGPGEQERLIAEFDFTIAQAVMWMQCDGPAPQWQSLCAADFYPDLAARRLTYTHPVRAEDAGGSLLRVRKFLKAGYNIQPGALAGVISRLFMAVRDRDEMDNEQRVATVLHGLLREVDPLIVVDGFDVVDEHATTEAA